MKQITLLVVGLLSASMGHALTTAYSPPVGGMTWLVPTGQTRSFSLPLLHAPVGAGAVVGKITAVGSNYFENSSAGWTASAFSTSSNPYYVRITSGSAEGRVMLVSTTANTTTRVYVNNDGTDLTTAVSVNDTYELVLADTLGSFFGSTSLQGGASASVADNVLVWGGASWLTFYYNNTRNRWERNSDTAASPTRDTYVLRPDRGLMITRRAATDLKMFVSGRVPDSAAKYYNMRPGITFLSNGLPADVTLGSLALQTNAPGWVSGTSGPSSTTSADLIQVWGGASWLIFYYDSVNGRWQRNSDTAASPTRNTYVIPAGRPIMIRRLTSAGTPSETIVQMPITYTIN